MTTQRTNRHEDDRADAMKFRVFAAMGMAAGAMSIDSILPAFDEIRSELGLAPDSSATAGLITAFFIGLAIGQIPMGLLADRFGRRLVLAISTGVFLLGTLGTAVAPSLGGMLVARFTWGLGAAGLRTGAIAMLRDRFAGARMAREMAFIMAVFLIVPIVTPALGSLLIDATSWRWVLALSGAFGVALAVFTAIIPETLSPQNRQPLRISQLGTAAKAIATSRTTARYTLLLLVIFGVFSSYLASSERIVGDIFHRQSQFPLLFGLVGIAMAILSISAGRNVERIGLLRLIRFAVLAYTAASAVVLAIAVASGGRPSFWPFWIAMTVLLAFHNVVFPNVNSAAMIPVGHVAGTAGALMGTLSTAGGAVIGAVIDHLWDGTVRPLSVAFAVSAVIACVLLAPVSESARR